MRRSLTPDIQPGFKSADLKVSLMGWGAYIALLTSYCSLYNAIVAGTPPDVTGTFLYALREWAIWWFLTPLALKALRWNERKQVRWRVSCIQVGVAVLLVSVAFRVAVDLLTDARGTAAVILIYMPRYLAVSIVLLLFWHFFLRNRPLQPQDRQTVIDADRHDRQSSSEPVVVVRGSEEAKSQTGTGSTQPEYPSSLLVDNGSAIQPLRLERIEFIAAAGKNVDIRSGNRDYVKRASMKEMEEMLPPSQFARVHRSYIVNIGEIDRISASRSGNDSIVLRGGRRITVGKIYRDRLRDSITKTL